MKCSALTSNRMKCAAAIAVPSVVYTKMKIRVEDK